MGNCCRAICFKERVKQTLLENLKKHYFDEFSVGGKAIEYGVDTRVWSKTSIEILLNPSFEDGILDIEIGSEIAKEIISELESEGYIVLNNGHDNGFLTFLGVPKTDPCAKKMVYSKVLDIKHRVKNKSIS